MRSSPPLLLLPEDKLDLLRFLDEFRYWHALTDERICKRCGHTITGAQILVMELHGTRGKLRLQCPTPGCASTPGDWIYANPVRAANERAEERDAERAAQRRACHAEGTARRKLGAAAERSSRFARPHSFRAALARLVLRPIATARHVFRSASRI